jgi:hypothetical protein
VGNESTFSSPTVANGIVFTPSGSNLFAFHLSN